MATIFDRDDDGNDKLMSRQVNGRRGSENGQQQKAKTFKSGVEFKLTKSAQANYLRSQMWDANRIFLN